MYPGLFNGALPAFDLADRDVLLALLRGVVIASLCLAFGTSLLRVLIAPPADAVGCRSVLLRMARGSMVLAVVAMLVWLVQQSIVIAGSATWSAVPNDMRTVLLHTTFGHFWIARLVVVAAALVLLGAAEWRWWAACLVSGVALGMQSVFGHSYSMDDAFGWAAFVDLLHVVSAGAWIGSLPGLLAMVLLLPARAAVEACRRYSPWGKLWLVVLAGSALGNYFIMIQSLPGLFGTLHGWIALFKLVLLVALVWFACLNRYRLAPALRNGGAAARRALVGSLGWQSATGLAALLAAAVLSATEPAMHLQPVWVFSERFSLDALSEPELWQEIAGALGLLALGLAVAALGVLWRAPRAALLAVAAFLVALAVPHFDLLAVPATPTSFFHQPEAVTGARVARGGAIFAAHCVACHGPGGKGDGKLAPTLPVPPADLTAHLGMHPDGDLFWWIGHGIVGPDGMQAMPGFADAISENARWDLIAWLRDNAGEVDTGAAVVHHHH